MGAILHGKIGAFLHLLESFFRDGNVKLTIRANPGMIGSCVVRHEVEDQFDSSLCEPLSQFGECGLAAQRLCDAVIRDGIRRGNDIVGSPVGQKSSTLFGDVRIIERHDSALFPSLPHTHEPNRIEMRGAPFFDLRIGNFR